MGAVVVVTGRCPAPQMAPSFLQPAAAHRLVGEICLQTRFRVLWATWLAPQRRWRPPLVHSTHLRAAQGCVGFCDTDCSAIGTDFAAKNVIAAKSVRSGCETVGENYTGVCPTSVSVRWTWIQILTSLAARSATSPSTVLICGGAIFDLLMSWWWVEKMTNRSKPTYFALKHLF